MTKKTITEYVITFMDFEDYTVPELFAKLSIYNTPEYSLEYDHNYTGYDIHLIRKRLQTDEEYQKEQELLTKKNGKELAKKKAQFLELKKELEEKGVDLS